MAEVVVIVKPMATESESSVATDTKKWRCDVCKVEFFDDFDEACAHEAICQAALDKATATAAATKAATSATASEKASEKVSVLVTQDTLPSAASVQNPKPAAARKRTQMTVTTAEPEEGKPPSPIITPTKQLPRLKKSSRKDGISKTNSKTKRNGTNQTGEMSSKSTSSSNPLVQAIKEELSKKIPALKQSALTQEELGTIRDLLQKLASLAITLEVLQETLIGKVVTKFQKHPDLGPFAKALVKKWKKIAAAATKTSQAASRAKANAATTAAASSNGTAKATTTQPHSFFQPRSAVSSASSKSAPKTKASKASVPTHSFFAPRKKSTSVADAVLEESKSLRRTMPPLACAENNKLSPETTKAVAAIFQPKKSFQQIIVEQRRAELEANRQAERLRERERNAKRATFFASQSQSQQQARAPAPPKRSLLPVAPRFPVPNHVVVVGGEQLDTDAVGTDPLLPNGHPFLRVSSSSTLSRATPTVSPSSTPWLSSPSALDTFDVNTTTFTTIQRALFETFSIPPSSPKNNNCGQPNSMQLVWSDALRMDKGTIVGSQPKQVFSRLAECIDKWRVARNESLEKTAERHRKLAARGKAKRCRPRKKAKPAKRSSRNTYGYEDDDWLVGDEYDSETEDTDGAPLCLLLGPHGCGKTSMVHSVAKHCGNCKVLEIHTAKARSGAALKHAIEEATQSNSSLEMLQSKTKRQQQQQTDRSFFSASRGKNCSSKRALEDSDDEDEEDDEQQHSEQKKSSLTIVLIDEVDILFEAEGDAGFWAALGSLARATKCPIFLTANQCPAPLDPCGSGSKLPCTIVELEKPAPEDCAEVLWGICRNPASNLEIAPCLKARGPEAIQKQLATVAECCGSDLRKLLHELQVFAALVASGSSSPWSGLPGKARFPKPVQTIEAPPPEAAPAFGSLHNAIPTVEALEPSRIPMHHHSVVLAKGTNFLGLLQQQHTTVLRIGTLVISEWQVVDDTTLRILCPPFEEDTDVDSNIFGRWIRRVLPLSIDCTVAGTQNPGQQQTILLSPSRILVSEPLANGSMLPGTYRPTIEYCVPEDTVIEDGDKEAEFDSKATDTTPGEESNRMKVEGQSAPAVDDTPTDPGLVAWDAGVRNDENTTGNDFTKPMIPPTGTTPEDLAIASELEACAERARDASDACLLEDHGDGLPYLSGACRGFAYDHTEDGCASHCQNAGAETLKMHEKSKPPREEKLFALGWKDNCCFYGNPDTYVTLPSHSQRMEAKTAMNYFRGNEVTAGQLACASANVGGASAAAVALSSEDLDPGSVVFRDDLDQFVHHRVSSGAFSSSHEDDSHLPRGVPQIVLDLPGMLRTRSSKGGANCDPSEEHQCVWDSLEARRTENLERLVDHTTEYILPPLSSSSSWQQKNDRSRWAYGRIGTDAKDDADRKRLVLECLPFLRRVATVERCAEFVAEQEASAAADPEASSSLRRSTRRATRAAQGPRRRHYFDKLSVILRRDEADLETSAVGALFADQWESGLVRPR